MGWPEARKFTKCFWLLQIPGSPPLWFYFHLSPCLGRNSQEHCKCCHTVWKSGRNHRSNKFISIVTGSEPSRLPEEWADLIHSSKPIHRNGTKKSIWGSREIACSEIQGRFQVLTIWHNFNTNQKGSSKFSPIWREWFIMSLWPTKPSAPEANVPFETSLLNAAGSTWQLKVMAAQVARTAPGEILEPALHFNVQHLHHFSFPFSSQALCWKGSRHRFICSFIYSLVLTCLLFRGYGIKHWGSKRTENGYLFLKNSYVVWWHVPGAKPQQCGNVKIGWGT